MRGRSAVSVLRAGLIAFALAGALLVALNVPLLLAAPTSDSFFTLTPFGRTGLVLLSAAFLAVCFWLLAAKTRLLLARVPGSGAGARLALLGADIALGWLIYLVLHQLSPQLYYSYYLTLFEGLPLQWVVGGIDWEKLAATVTIGPKDQLSALLASIGFWAVPIFTALLHRAHANR